jgi:hypothetical protein
VKFATTAWRSVIKRFPSSFVTVVALSLSLCWSCETHVEEADAVRVFWCEVDVVRELECSSVDYGEWVCRAASCCFGLDYGGWFVVLLVAVLRMSGRSVFQTTLPAPSLSLALIARIDTPKVPQFPHGGIAGYTTGFPPGSALSQPQSALLREPVSQSRVHQDIHRTVPIICDLFQFLV